MALLRGCDFPDALLYHPDSHLWFVPAGDSLYRVGVTQLGIALSGEILLFTPKPVGASCDAGRSFGNALPAPLPAELRKLVPRGSSAATIELTYRGHAATKANA